jgi:hypothetical protein
VTIDGFGFVIGFIEHLEIIRTSNYDRFTNSHILHFAKLVLSLRKVLCLHRLSGSCFQRHRSLGFHVHGFTSSLAVANPTTWLTKHKQKLTAGNQPARSHLASGPAGTHGHIFFQCQDFFFSFRYIALDRTQQEVPLPTVHLLLGDFNIRADRTENTVPNCTPIGYLV